uniref:Uncharacterized protein n=1 Tax=Arundo donax TaxID=35708 RepID=A0A0A9CKG5_ARUDO
MIQSGCCTLCWILFTFILEQIAGFVVLWILCMLFPLDEMRWSIKSKLYVFCLLLHL